MYLDRVRLTRAEQQLRTRAAVLTAATAEFAEHGYADAKVDRIAERAELTRGAVYSNFAGKRALYLAVLAETVRAEPPGPPPPAGLDPAEAFARVWLERLPLSGDTSAGGRLRARSLAGVFDDEAGRAAVASVSRLEALLLATALESAGARPGRRVRLAELLLTLLHGAGSLAQAAPGFGDPFAVALACRHLATLDLADTGDPPHLPFVAPPEACRDAWQPPSGLVDELTGEPVALDGDGVVVTLGTGRLGAAEEAVRAGARVTVVVVTGDPAETGALVRLRVADLAACLRRAFGAAYRPPLRLVVDDGDALGAGRAADTEVAVRIRGGLVVARARGRGAGHAVATS